MYRDLVLIDHNVLLLMATYCLVRHTERRSHNYRIEIRNALLNFRNIHIILTNIIKKTDKSSICFHTCNLFDAPNQNLRMSVERHAQNPL